MLYLLGYPGVGKYTVARAIAARSGAVVVDNQLVNHPILAVLRWDGVSRLPEGTLARTAPIRAAVLDAIAELAPPDVDHVLTNVLEDTPEDRALYDRVRDVARRRGVPFWPVLLTCDPAEQRRRVAGADRRARLKVTDPDDVAAYVRDRPLYVPDDPALLTLDTTALAPDDAAAAILAHAAAR